MNMKSFIENHKNINMEHFLENEAESINHLMHNSREWSVRYSFLKCMFYYKYYTHNQINMLTSNILHASLIAKLTNKYH